MIVTVPAARIDEVRDVRIALHRHHSALPIPPGWVARDEDAAWRGWRALATAVLGDGTAELFAHTSDGGVDGTALVALLDPADLARPVLEPDGPHAELLTLAVLPDARSGGIGSLLYRAAADWARERGAVTMHVDTRADNLDGLRFYERVGARPAFVQLMQPL